MQFPFAKKLHKNVFIVILNIVDKKRGKLERIYISFLLTFFLSRHHLFS